MTIALEILLLLFFLSIVDLLLHFALITFNQLLHLENEI